MELPSTNVYKIEDEAQLIQFITSDRFAMQQKLDGRRMIAVKTDKVRAYNKEHNPFNMPTLVERTLMELPGEPWLFDGELCGTDYHIFDVCEVHSQGMKRWDFDQRQLVLSSVMAQWSPEHLHKVQTWYEPKEKLFALLQLRNMRKEGVIFRPRTYSAYFKGAVHKFKFYNTVDCIVMNRRVEGKRAIEIAVLDDGDYHNLGKVKCEFDLQDKMSTSQVVEVRYRKLSESGKLVEPVLVRLRDDKRAYLCTAEQLMGFGGEGIVQVDKSQQRALALAAEHLGMEYTDALKLIDNTAETD